MPKSAMKPLIGGTFIMLLLLLAVLRARDVIAAWESDLEAKEQNRRLMEERVAAGERAKEQEAERMQRPTYDISLKAAQLQREAEAGDAYAQAAYATVLRDCLENNYQLRPEYEPVGRLLIGPDFDQVHKTHRFLGQDSLRSFCSDYPKWFRRSALQGNAYGMQGLSKSSLMPPSASGTLKPDYAEYLKWAMLTNVHADETEATLPPRFAVLGRIRRSDISSMKKELVKLVSETELREIERQVRDFKPVKTAR
jgi:hypothetical protein